MPRGGGGECWKGPTGDLQGQQVSLPADRACSLGRRGAGTHVGLLLLYMLSVENSFMCNMMNNYHDNST